MADRSRQGGHAARAARRQRQGNVAGGRSRQRKVRLSEAEDEALAAVAAAEGVSVSRLLLERGLADDGGVTIEERRQWLATLFAIERLAANLALNARQVTARLDSEQAAPMGELAERCAALVDRTGAAVEVVGAWHPGAPHERA